MSHTLQHAPAQKSRLSSLWSVTLELIMVKKKKKKKSCMPQATSWVCVPASMLADVCQCSHSLQLVYIPIHPVCIHICIYIYCVCTDREKERNWRGLQKGAPLFSILDVITVGGSSGASLLCHRTVLGGSRVCSWRWVGPGQCGGARKGSW